MNRLLAQLPPDRAAVVAFIVATSAEWSAVERARREDVQDIGTDDARVLIRGKKRETRWRTVPLEAPWQRQLVQYALRYASGKGGKLFTPWSNVRRDLHKACESAAMDPVTPNDLRRTFASWMWQQGVPPHLIGRLMGHTDSRMVERCYGQHTVHTLRMGVSSALQRPEVEVAPNAASAAAPSEAAPETSNLSGPGSAAECSRYAAHEEPINALTALRALPRNEKTRAKRGSLGAQRQNRTADTRIFNPTIKAG